MHTYIYIHITIIWTLPPLEGSQAANQEALLDAWEVALYNETVSTFKHMSRPFISWTLTLGFWWDHATNPRIISTKKTFAMQDPALGPQRQKHRKLWPFHFFSSGKEAAQPTKKIYLVVVNRFYLVVILSAMS